MDFCPVCSLDLSLVTNKDFHVNSCFENNNITEEVVNRVEEIPSWQKVKPSEVPVKKLPTVPVRPTTLINNKLEEREPKKKRTHSGLSTYKSSVKESEKKEIYVICPYINCDFSSLTEFFPIHVMTDHIEEPKQNYACPICNAQGHKYQPKADTNLLLHISETHPDYLDIYDDPNEPKKYNSNDDKKKALNYNKYEDFNFKDNKINNNNNNNPYIEKKYIKSVEPSGSWDSDSGLGGLFGNLSSVDEDDEEEFKKTLNQYYSKVRNNKDAINDDTVIDMSFLSDMSRNNEGESKDYWDDDRAEEELDEQVKAPTVEIKIETTKIVEVKKEITITKEVKIETITTSPKPSPEAKRPMFIQLEGHSSDYLAASVNIEIIPGQECPICYDSFIMHQVTSRLECFCLYHKDCIELWWKKKDKRTCPFHVFEETKKT